jgi:hypothetical protein
MRAVNLIPGEERASTKMDAGRAGGGVYAVFAILGGLAVMALLYGLSAHRISSGKAQVASLNERAQQVQARAAALAPYTSFAAMREQRAQDVATLVNSRFDWAQAFHELARVLPANISLSSLDGQISAARETSAGAASTASSSGSSSVSSGPAGASGASAAASSPVSSTTPPGSVPTFTLAGCTTSQTAVAVMLDRLRLINGAEEVTLQSATKSSSAGGGGGNSGHCGESAVTFAATITFDALPSVPTNGAGASSAFASAGGGESSTGASR